MTGPLPGTVTVVLGTATGGTGAHVRSLVAGLAERGIAVRVAGPSSAGARFSLSEVPLVSFTPVEIGNRPRAGDLAVMVRLRRLLPRGAPGAVVHAHGMRAGALTVLALTGVRGGGRPGVVVTVHNAPPSGWGAAALVYRLLERVVAAGADAVLCVSPDLERRMGRAGARRVRRAVVAAPGVPAGPVAMRATGEPAARVVSPVDAPVPVDAAADSPDRDVAAATRADVPSAGVAAAGRPLVLAVGRLAPQKGFDVLLKAAAGWRDLEPMPLVVIAGDGPLARDLRARAVALDAPAVFLGHSDNVSALLAAASVFVLPSRWEGQPLVLQEALRAGTPIVAARTGGVPSLTGEDAALLVPPGNARALGTAVRAVLTDPLLAARLRAATRARAAALPGDDDAVTAALAAYASVT